MSSTHNFVTDRLKHFLDIKIYVVVPLDYQEREIFGESIMAHVSYQGIFTNEINFYFASHMRTQIFVIFGFYYLFIHDNVLIQKIAKFNSNARKKCLAVMTILVNKRKEETNFKDIFVLIFRTLF